MSLVKCLIELSHHSTKLLQSPWPLVPAQPLICLVAPKFCLKNGLKLEKFFSKPNMSVAVNSFV